MIHPRKREFLALARQTGWNQAELARKLEITPGGMSGLVKGGTIPSAGLLKLLRLVVFTEKPEALQAGAARPTSLPPEPKDFALEGLLTTLASMTPRDRTDMITQFTAIGRVILRRRTQSGAPTARGATASNSGATSGKKRGGARSQAA